MEITSVVTHTLLFIALYTEVYLLLTYLESRVQEREFSTSHTTPQVLPSVAIIVPCFNEEETVAGTIRSLLALAYPHKKLSIIAVNDGSTDATLSVLHTFSHEPQITILSKENGGKHSAMNMALAHTTAEIVGCLDADSYVSPDALLASITRFAETNAAAITPAIVTHTPDNWLRFIQQAEYALSVFMRRAFADTQAVFITPGPFSLFKRDILAAIGGWKHAHGTEDMEIAMRLQEHGYRIANQPLARVFTKTPKTVRALYKQRVRWTYGFIMNVIDYKHALFNPRFGTLGVLVLPTALISIAAALYFTGMVLTYSIQELYDYYILVSLTGFSISIPTLSMFFLNTTTAALLAYVLVGLALTLIYIGRSMSDAPLHPVSIPLYILLYSFLAPWWLLGAVSRAGFRAQAPWR